MTKRRKATGAQGETLAAAHLREKGFSILHTNWRCRIGEIDLVARDGPALVFVEVRTRRSVHLGCPEESVTPAKQRRLAELAQTYLLFLETAGRPWAGPWRIDLVAVQLDPWSGAPIRLSHMTNAVEGD